MDFVELQILPKQDKIPEYDPTAVRARYIEYHSGEVYRENEMNEALIADLLNDIPVFLEAMIYLDPRGEDDWMEVLSDGEWAALSFVSQKWQVSYYSYHPYMDGMREYTTLRSEGEVRVEACFALKDMARVRRAVEYFIRTGELYPGIDWAKQNW